MTDQGELTLGDLRRCPVEARLVAAEALGPAEIGSGRPWRTDLPLLVNFWSSSARAGIPDSFGSDGS